MEDKIYKMYKVSIIPNDDWKKKNQSTTRHSIEWCYV